MRESKRAKLTMIQGRLLKFDVIRSTELTKLVDRFIQGLSITVLASSAVAPGPWTGYPFFFLDAPN